MSTPPSRRARKRLATRRAISDVATRLFYERGFDRVTVDEIAEAADVGRMTVFNHFRRKEDLFFDMGDEVRDEMVSALGEREAAVSAAEAFRRFAHRAVAERRDYVRFSAENLRFVDTLRASPALTARWRAIRDEVAEALAAVLAGDALPATVARLAAHLLAAAWSLAADEGEATFRASQDGAAAEAAFLALIDRGCAGVEAALAWVP